jgi:hypothetical protein
MAFTTLVFFACLTTSCQTIRLQWEGSPFECMLLGQQQIVSWLAERPGYERRGRYSCVIERTGAGRLA